jgi:hypothetical protein
LASSGGCGTYEIQNYDTLLEVISKMTVDCGIVNSPEFDAPFDTYNSFNGLSFSDFLTELSSKFSACGPDEYINVGPDFKLTTERTSVVTGGIDDDRWWFRVEYGVTGIAYENTDGSGPRFYNVAVSIVIAAEEKLAGAMTYADVLDEAITLLDEFPLHDDAIYPWRTDAKTWLQPLVHYDAANVVQSINWTVDDDCERKHGPFRFQSYQLDAKLRWRIVPGVRAIVRRVSRRTAAHDDD